MSKFDESPFGQSPSGASFAMPATSFSPGMGLASAGVQAGVNYFLNKNQFEREQKAWRSNQLFLNDLAQKNQRHAAENVVEGYEMAGLSPALAVNGDFSPAQPGSAPLQNKQSTTLEMLGGMSAMAQIGQTKAQTELTEEMTRKAAAEADITERESGRMTDEDIQVTKSYRATIERLYNESKDPDIRAIYAAELEALDDSSNKGEFTIGHIRGLTELQKMLVNTTAADRQVIANRLDKAVLSRQVKSQKFIDALAKMPLVQYQKMNAEILNLEVMKGKLAADTELSYQQRNESIQKVIAQQQSVLKEYLESPELTANDGEWSAFLRHMLFEIPRTATDVVKAIK